MTKCNSPKKTSPKDWHRADIVAELRKAGWSLRRLSEHHNYASPTTLTTALERAWPKGERLIASAIGMNRPAYGQAVTSARIVPPREEKRHDSDSITLVQLSWTLCQFLHRSKTNFCLGHGL